MKNRMLSTSGHCSTSLLHYPSGQTRLLSLLVLFVLLTSQLLAQVDDFITGTSLNFLTLHDGRLYWKADCAQPGSSASQIGMCPAGAPGFTPLFVRASPFPPDDAGLSQIAADLLRVYWIDCGGQVQRVDNAG